MMNESTNGVKNRVLQIAKRRRKGETYPKEQIFHERRKSRAQYFARGIDVWRLLVSRRMQSSHARTQVKSRWVHRRSQQVDRHVARVAHSELARWEQALHLQVGSSRRRGSNYLDTATICLPQHPGRTLARNEMLAAARGKVERKWKARRKVGACGWRVILRDCVIVCGERYSLPRILTRVVSRERLWSRQNPPK